jgi:hypothetical protein
MFRLRKVAPVPDVLIKNTTPDPAPPSMVVRADEALAQPL